MVKIFDIASMWVLPQPFNQQLVFCYQVDRPTPTNFLKVKDHLLCF